MTARILVALFVLVGLAGASRAGGVAFRERALYQRVTPQERAEWDRQLASRDQAHDRAPGFFARTLGRPLALAIGSGLAVNALYYTVCACPGAWLMVAVSAAAAAAVFAYVVRTNRAYHRIRGPADRQYRRFVETLRARQEARDRGEPDFDGIELRR